MIDDEIEDSCSAIPGAMVAFVTLVGTHTPYCYLQFRDHNLLTEQTVSLWMLLQLHEVLHSANYELGSEHRLSPSFVLQMMKMQEKAPTGAFSPPFRASPASASFRRTRRDPAQCADQPPLR